MGDRVDLVRASRRWGAAPLLVMSLLVGACGSDEPADSGLASGSASAPAASSDVADSTAPEPADTTPDTASDATPAPEESTSVPDTTEPEPQPDPATPDGDCAFEYTIGTTQVVGEEGDVVLWSDSAERESRVLVGDPNGDGHGAQLTFTTETGIRSTGDPVTGVGPYFVRFADFMADGETSLGASVSNTGEGEITMYDAGVAVAGQATGTVGGIGNPLDFSLSFAVYDNGDDTGDADVFRCIIGVSTGGS
jgi:hypothetical protein